MKTLFLLVFAAALAALSSRDRGRVIRIAGEIAPERPSAAGSWSRLAGVWACF